MEQLYALAKQHFDLLPQDLWMIPLGGLLFFVFWKLLTVILFKPCLRLVELREARTEAAFDTAEEVTLKATQAETDYEQKLLDARIEAMRQKLSDLSKAKSKAQEIVTEAQTTAQSKLEAARAEAERQAEALRADTLAQADSLADEVVQKLFNPPAEPQSVLH